MYGFGLCIDGHRPGNSSSQKLARIPFTELKVDSSSVRGENKKFRRAMLESVHDLAKKSGGTAVASGVGTAEEIVVLRDIGYDVAQGPFIAEAMKGQDFLRWAVDKSHSGAKPGHEPTVTYSEGTGEAQKSRA